MVEHDGYIHSAPQLIVEVLSPPNRLRDREEIAARLREHRGAGVVGGLAGGTHRRGAYLENGQLRTAAILAEGTLEPREFPHVHVDIAGIWAD